MPDRLRTRSCVIPLPFDFTRVAHCERSRSYRCSHALLITSAAPAVLARALVALIYAYTRQSEIAIDLSAQSPSGCSALAHLRFEVDARRRLAALRSREQSGSSSVGLSISRAHGELDLDAVLPARHDVHFLVRSDRQRTFFHVVYDAQLFAERTIGRLAERFVTLSACPG